MKKVVVFGVLDTAQLAFFYLTHDTDVEVVAFTVNKEYLPQDGKFLGLPVVEFESLGETYPPTEYLLFAPMTGSKMNKNRQRVYELGKQKGYDFYTYISSKATYFDNEIGENCFILEDNTIQPFVKLGDNVVLWSGNHIGHHSTIGDHVFFTSHVVLSGHCIVGNNAWFGVNATIKNDCEIGEGAFIAMSASVVKNVSPWSIVKGLPGREVGDSRRLKF